MTKVSNFLNLFICMFLLKQSLLIILTESFIIKEIDRIRLDHENLINEN